MSTCVFCWLLFINVVARFKLKTNEKIDNIEKYLIILFVFCHFLYFRKFSNFQIMFAFYLYHDNVKKRIINFLCSLEFTSFYKIMKDHMNNIHQKKCIYNKVINHAHNIVLTYNNFEFSKNKKDKRIDEIKRFKFITFAFMFEFHNWNAVFLLRFMWNFQKYFLISKMIVSFVINNVLNKKIIILNSLYISID